MKLFTATWCRFCQPVKQYIIDNKMDVELIDVDEAVEESLSNSITQIPALVMTDGTKVLESERILSLLESFNAK